MSVKISLWQKCIISLYLFDLVRYLTTHKDIKTRCFYVNNTVPSCTAMNACNSFIFSEKTVE